MSIPLMPNGVNCCGPITPEDDKIMSAIKALSTYLTALTSLAGFGNWTGLNETDTKYLLAKTKEVIVTLDELKNVFTTKPSPSECAIPPDMPTSPSGIYPYHNCPYPYWSPDDYKNQACKCEYNK